MDGARRLRCPAEIYRKLDVSRNATKIEAFCPVKTRELETVPST